MELLDVGLVEVYLGHRAGDLGVREHAGQLALGEKALDLFEFLKFHYGHLGRFHIGRRPASGVGEFIRSEAPESSGSIPPKLVLKTGKRVMLGALLSEVNAASYSCTT